MIYLSDLSYHSRWLTLHYVAWYSSLDHQGPIGMHHEEQLVKLGPLCAICVALVQVQMMRKALLHKPEFEIYHQLLIPMQHEVPAYNMVIRYLVKYKYDD